MSDRNTKNVQEYTNRAMRIALLDRTRQIRDLEASRSIHQTEAQLFSGTLASVRSYYDRIRSYITTTSRLLENTISRNNTSHEPDPAIENAITEAIPSDPALLALDFLPMADSSADLVEDLEEDESVLESFERSLAESYATDKAQSAQVLALTSQQRIYYDKVYKEACNRLRGERAAVHEVRGEACYLCVCRGH